MIEEFFKSYYYTSVVLNAVFTFIIATISLYLSYKGLKSNDTKIRASVSIAILVSGQYKSLPYISICIQNIGVLPVTIGANFCTIKTLGNAKYRCVPLDGLVLPDITALKNILENLKNTPIEKLNPLINKIIEGTQTEKELLLITQFIEKNFNKKYLASLKDTLHKKDITVKENRCVPFKRYPVTIQPRKQMVFFLAQKQEYKITSCGCWKYILKFFICLRLYLWCFPLTTVKICTDDGESFKAKNSEVLLKKDPNF